MTYKILTGMNWTGPDGEDVRAEAGEVRDDVPAVSVPWLLADGHLEVSKEPAPAVAPKIASVPDSLSAFPPATLSWPVSEVVSNPEPVAPLAEPNQPSVLQAELADLAAERAALAEERAAVEAMRHPAPVPDVRGL